MTTLAQAALINISMYLRLSLLSFLIMPTATAQTMVYKPVLCGETSVVKEATILQYKEELVRKEKNWLTGTDVEWYENTDEGTWTLIESRDGRSCLLAIGKLPGSKT